MEGEARLDRILENTPLLEPLCVELELSHEEVSSAEVEPITSLERPSLEPESKEGFKPWNLSYFEDELLEEFRNTSKYSCQKKQPVPVTPLEPLDKESLRESIKVLTTIMSSEWVDEGECSSEEIQIRTPSSTIHCKIQGT